MSDNRKYLEANRELWNCRTPIHANSDFYDLHGFRSGKSSLRGPEVAELAPLVFGKTLLHLQCHFGLDTLSLARLGAVVTGVDFSDAGIAQARALADELQIRAEFVCASVFELEDRLSSPFDFVFTSYGVLGWLPDLHDWAAVVERSLKPGGTFYMVEFHPNFQQLDAVGERKYSYFHSAVPDCEVTRQTYTDGASHEPLEEYWWNHPISASINALLAHGLVLQAFHEYPYSPYRLADAMIERQPGQWVHSVHGDQIPYLFSVRAQKPSG